MNKKIGYIIILILLIIGICYFSIITITDDNSVLGMSSFDNCNITIKYIK